MQIEDMSTEQILQHLIQRRAFGLKKVKDTKPDEVVWIKAIRGHHLNRFLVADKPSDWFYLYPKTEVITDEVNDDAN